MGKNHTGRTFLNLLVGLFLLYTCFGYGQEVGRHYIAEHQLYNKALISSFRQNCLKANENYDAFIQDYKGSAQQYWKDRAARKKLDCKQSGSNNSSTMQFTARNVLSDLPTGALRKNSRIGNISKEDKKSLSTALDKVRIKDKMNPSQTHLQNESQSKIQSENARPFLSDKVDVDHNSANPLNKKQIQQDSRHKQGVLKRDVEFTNGSDENIDMRHHYRVQFATRNEPEYSYISLASLGPVYSEKRQGADDYNYFIGNFSTFNEAKELGLKLKEYGYSKTTIVEYDKGVFKQFHVINPKTIEELPLPEPSCIVIVGSFKSSERASDLSNKVKKDGYKTFNEVHNGFYRVGIEFECINDNIDAKLLEMRAKYNSEAWIRK